MIHLLHRLEEITWHGKEGKLICSPRWFYRKEAMAGVIAFETWEDGATEEGHRREAMVGVVAVETWEDGAVKEGHRREERLLRTATRSSRWWGHGSSLSKREGHSRFKSQSRTFFFRQRVEARTDMKPGTGESNNVRNSTENVLKSNNF